MKKIALIPIDNRPICYTLVQDILAQDKNISLFMPERSLLGSLTNQANINGIYDFINNLEEIDILVISLDTIAYGGLVSSRRCPETFEEIKQRLLKFKKVIQKKAKKVLAFSSIMRISNNNINEEEKEYWSQWGKRIFEFSYYQHKSRKEKSYNCVYNQIPEEILNDYLDTRKRNFDINKLYLDWVEDKTLDTLVFSKDDTGQYGLNVEEAEFLDKQIKHRNLNAFIKTGADEIPLTLIARAINSGITIKTQYTWENSTNEISKYEDISVKDCIEGQLMLADCKIAQNADLTFIINNFEAQQGDYVLGECINVLTKQIDFPEKKFFIADISNANGADCGLIKQLISKKINKNFIGFCAYNTSANSAGCAILSAIVNYNAQKNNSYSENAFKKLLFIRLMDDWAYQANIRKFVHDSAPYFKQALKEKSEDLKNFEKIIANYLDFKYNNVSYSLPWNRSFEAEINVENL